MVHAILSHASSCIPQREIAERRSTHEWLTPEVISMVDRKRKAAGTPEEGIAAEDCSRAIMNAFHEYVAKSREDLQSLQRGSKLWWKKARKLAHLSGPIGSMPALKGRDDWVLQPKAKADLLQETFTSKFVVPELKHNRFSAVDCIPSDKVWKCHISRDLASTVLRSIREESATGPDGLPSRILKRMAHVLDYPIAELTKKIIESGCWPSIWRLH